MPCGGSDDQFFRELTVLFSPISLFEKKQPESLTQQKFILKDSSDHIDILSVGRLALGNSRKDHQPPQLSCRK